MEYGFGIVGLGDRGRIYRLYRCRSRWCSLGYDPRGIRIHGGRTTVFSHTTLRMPRPRVTFSRSFLLFLVAAATVTFWSDTCVDAFQGPVNMRLLSSTSSFPCRSTASQEEVPPSAEEKSSPKPPVKCPDCDLCDGSGRIIGGIGVFLDWWPIKAYRPCPK